MIDIKENNNSNQAVVLMPMDSGPVEILPGGTRILSKRKPLLTP